MLGACTYGVTLMYLLLMNACTFTAVGTYICGVASVNLALSFSLLAPVDTWWVLRQ